MAILHIGHIKAALKRRFDGLIDLSDVPNAKGDDLENFFLTRSLAAFVIAELAQVDDKIAAKAIVDGSKDNGIDAFYFDATDRVCYLVQSKWIHNRKGSIEVGEVHKFLQGVTDLLGSKLESFDKLRQKKADIDAALTDSSARFVLVTAYTGEQQLSAEALRSIEEFLGEQNDPTELISFQQLRQADLHAIVARQAAGESVKLTILLHEWGKVTEPFLAYYGQVDLQDIGTWKQFGQSLYHRNLRGFKGSTDVNEAIVKTARFAPEHFWYFNNGITILCEKLSKQPLGGSNRDSGVFECEGASVVNGAQTVGSIIAAIDGGSNGLRRARVLVKIIDLEHCPPSREFQPQLRDPRPRGPARAGLAPLVRGRRGGRRDSGLPLPRFATHVRQPPGDEGRGPPHGHGVDGPQRHHDDDALRPPRAIPRPRRRRAARRKTDNRRVN
jgi:hypothetical protein